MVKYTGDQAEAYPDGEYRRIPKAGDDEHRELPPTATSASKKKDDFFALLWIYAMLLCCAGGLAYLMWCSATSGDPEYSVAITGVGGLDPALDLRSDRRPTLSPVLNLTVHINELNKFQKRLCIGGHSAEVVVSYNNALLGKGAVPWFCVEQLQEGGVETMVWGMDLQVPRFLRDLLAAELERNEAVLDVTVTVPPSCLICRDRVLACETKIGGGLCPCRLE